MIFSVVVLLFFVQSLVKMAHSLFNNYLMGINEDDDFIDDNEEEYDHDDSDDYEDDDDDDDDDEEYEDESDEGYDDRESPIMTRSRSRDVEPNEEHYIGVMESLAAPVVDNAVLAQYQVPSRP